MRKIRTGDQVLVTSGRNKGQRGVVRQNLMERDRVVIEGVNMRKRHMKPSQVSPEGGIVQFEAPVHVSNVMLLDPTTGEPTRVRAGVGEDGKRQRISVRSGNAIPRVMD